MKTNQKKKSEKKRLLPSYLRLKLITRDVPQRLLIVSPCDCSETFSLSCTLWDIESRMHVEFPWLAVTLPPVQRTREVSHQSTEKLQSVSETSLQLLGGKPQHDWSLVMGTKRSISNASRKLAAVVKEFAGWKGPCLCLGKSCFWRGSTRGCLFKPRP